MDTATGVDHARYALRPCTATPTRRPLDRPIEAEERACGLCLRSTDNPKTGKPTIRRFAATRPPWSDSDISDHPLPVGASGSAGGEVPWKRARPGENSPPALPTLTRPAWVSARMSQQAA
ncbi:hypothetical protein PGTUg99_027613 [Puccinia graminis f. sp. tritici]|uniref:Uncharacterized protein n=1 Tax=Puccinia graminis f. sp. tritici TaxID=56615 RepID=A0A5B0RHC7_PUCGR|nr:hypothetical protein PGTUg99_027613 [Puccinia graminis f. sp. tritici]